MNLLTETLRVLQDNGKTVNDIKWVGSEKFGWCRWDEVLKLFGSTNYDDGYGGQEIARDLMVVGDGWWMERMEYDGSEWWRFMSPPKKPTEKKIPSTVKLGSWETLSEQAKV